MSIALHFDYEFELDGKTYSVRGAEYGETEKESDIEALNADIEDLKISAICDAFALAVGYDDEKIKNLCEKAKFNNDFFEVFN